jgi:hypothetical protein
VQWQRAWSQTVALAGSRRRSTIVACAAAGVAVLLAVPLIRSLSRSSAPFAGLAATATPGSLTSGRATFQSNPEGAPVSIGGSVRGTTPLTLSLPVGEHLVEIGSGPLKRQLNTAIAADTVASYYVELSASPGGRADGPPNSVAVAAPNGAAKAAAKGPARGAGLSRAVGDLEVFSDPPGAQVSVDGSVRGVTPLLVSDLTSGEHRLVLNQNGTAINRNVRIAPGATASVVISSRTPEAAAGWVSIKVPFEMKIFENGALLGTTATNRIMLPAGAHTFDLVSEALGFSARLPVRVVAGTTIDAAVKVPTGLLSVNAQPWAEVVIDGQAVGTTPLGNLAVPIGAREVVWRHPQFGERRRLVTVKEHEPVRIGVDFGR